MLCVHQIIIEVNYRPHIKFNLHNVVSPIFHQPKSHFNTKSDKCNLYLNRSVIAMQTMIHRTTELIFISIKHKKLAHLTVLMREMHHRSSNIFAFLRSNDDYSALIHHQTNAHS